MLIQKLKSLMGISSSHRDDPDMRTIPRRQVGWSGTGEMEEPRLSVREHSARMIRTMTHK